MAHYPKYLSDNPNSYLVRILGLISIAEPDKAPEYFMLMRNVALPRSAEAAFFDLKGSTHGRRSTSMDKIKKDLDFIDSGYALTNTPDLLNQLQRDVEFLRQFEVIDYSLFCALECDGNWNGGIIDIFTKYTAKKRLENLVFGAVYDNISCQNPNTYATRFLDFTKRCLKSDSAQV